MLAGRRNPHKSIKVFISPTKEADELAKLKVEKEILARENRESAQALDAKRKSLNLDYKSCQKIEKEHFAKIEKLQNEYNLLFNKVQDKNEEYIKLAQSISSLNNLKQELEKQIPVLENNKLQLEKDIYEKTEKNNVDKKNSEVYLSGIRKKIDEEATLYNELNQKLILAKEELRETIEKTNEENRILSFKQRDLEIYEARLRKKYPNDTIILS